MVRSRGSLACHNPPARPSCERRAPRPPAPFSGADSIVSKGRGAISGFPGRSPSTYRGCVPPEPGARCVGSRRPSPAVTETPGRGRPSDPHGRISKRDARNSKPPARKSKRDERKTKFLARKSSSAKTCFSTGYARPPAEIALAAGLRRQRSPTSSARAPVDTVRSRRPPAAHCRFPSHPWAR